LVTAAPPKDRDIEAAQDRDIEAAENWECSVACYAATS